MLFEINAGLINFCVNKEGIPHLSDELLYLNLGHSQVKQHGRFIILGSTIQGTCYLGDTQPVVCSDYIFLFRRDSEAGC